MRIAMTGATGLIGSALAPALAAQGHEIIRLVRRNPRAEAGEYYFDPLVAQMDWRALEGVEAVIHLAGENIGQRWTRQVKERIHRSRVVGAAMLVRAMKEAPQRPRVFISASAVGYYGPRGHEPITEEAGPGQGFLARVCQEWEAAAMAAHEMGVRVVLARMGVVLSARGGALARLLPIFRLGLGGPVGSGQQYVSWVALDDVVAAFLWLLEKEELTGPFNVTSPEPVTFAELARTLGRVLGRPAFLRVPGFLLRLALGEMAQETLLSGQRALPKRLLDSGFQFRFPRLEEALHHLLGRS
jgi:uncharacterized protein (TIGR01777 family)